MRRRRWPRLLAVTLIFVLAVLTGWALALRAYLVHVGDQRLAAVLAALDESEPGWRWDDLQARREVIPEGENSATIVLAVGKLLPRDWSQTPATTTEKPEAQLEPLPSLLDRLEEIEPNRALDAKLAADLRVKLLKLAPALAEARKVIDRPKGRYAVAWTKHFLSTPLGHVQDVRRCAYLLGFDAAARADDKDYDGALASSCGVLNAGRSLGDEPASISQLVRVACDAQAVRNVERVLAQGQVSPEALAAASTLLADEASQNLWLIVARGERATAPLVLESLYRGELTFRQMARGDYAPNRTADLFGWLYTRPLLHTGDAAVLEYGSRLVQAAQLPANQRRQRVDAVAEEIRQIKAGKPSSLIAVVVLVSPVVQEAAKHDCHQARLRCALAGMALERYRLAHGGWPDTLNQLIPNLLAKIPEDPFDSEPLRYHRLEDGVVVYSIGPDKQDNGGLLAGQNPKVPDTDLGFRLWDPAHRCQPAATSIKISP